MLKHYYRTFAYILPMLDALLVAAAWLASYWIRFSLAPVIPVTKGFPDFASYASLAPLVAVIWMSSLTLLRVYETRQLLAPERELRLVLKGHGAALLLFVAAAYLLDDDKYSRGVMIDFAVVSGTLLILSRVMLRKGLAALRSKGISQRKVLAVGEGAAMERLLVRLENSPELGLRVVGAITAAGHASELCGRPVLGRYDDTRRVVHEHQIDEVFIALPAARSSALDHLLESLRGELVDVRVIPDVSPYITLTCQIEEFDGLPVVRLNDSPLDGWGALFKRLTDVVLSAIALVLLAPVLLTIAVLVKATSPGPVLYAQERLGLDGRRFPMLKFRSMRVDAESGSGPVWTTRSDDRRTAIGTFLRKTSLDELPQLWNVLRGDMSLVGPRPERPFFVDQFRGNLPDYMLRHKMRTGITGWAQVNGWRGNTPVEQRLECDLFYIRNWSYALDLKILLLTLWKGFVNKNAY